MLGKLTLSYFNTSAGYWLSGFLVPLIVLDLTQSAFIVSLSYALNILPYIIITPFSGVMRDLLNRKRVILFGELACSLAAIVLFWLPYRLETYPMVMFLGFIISVFSAIHHPVFQSIIPELYQVGLIKKINAQVGMIDSFVSIIAPVSVGVMLIGLEKKYIALLISLLYFISFLCIRKIDYRKTQGKVKISVKIVWDSLLEGVYYVFNHQALRNVACLFFCVNFGIRVILANLIWILSSVYGVDEENISLYFIIIGLGAILGARLAVLFIGKYSDVTIIAICTAIVAGCSFSLLLVRSPLTLSILWALSSMVQSVIVVTFFTYRQRITDISILSRVVSVTRLISYLSIPLAALVSGRLLVNVESVSTVYTISGVTILCGLSGFLFLQRNVKVQAPCP